MSEEKSISEKLEPEELEPEVIKQIPTQRVIRKIGRNEKCPCGSEKKYKKCCIGKLDNHMYNIPLMRFNYSTFINKAVESVATQQIKNADKEQKIIKLN